MYTDLTYDEAVARIEQLTKELGTAGAMGMEEYQQKAHEAQQLIAYCQSCLTDLEKGLNQPLNS